MKRALVIIGGLLSVVALAVGWLLVSAQLQANHDRVALDLVYRAHALGVPFTLVSRGWEPNGEVGGHGHWRYVYRAAESVPAAAVEAQGQLSHGGYQTVAGVLDSTNTESPLLRRDLISGGVSLTVAVVSGASSGRGAAGSSEVIVTVGELGQD